MYCVNLSLLSDPSKNYKRLTLNINYQKYEGEKVMRFLGWGILTYKVKIKRMTKQKRNFN